jgi:hypothetical protein
MFRELLLTARTFDVYFRAYDIFLGRTPEGEYTAGHIDDAAAAEIAVLDTVGTGNEETVGVGV